MTTTPNLGITLVEQSQAQKEITINEAFARVDALMNNGAISINSTPPGSPSAGDVYIVGASPTGVWSGHANAMAYYDQIWRFITPHAGMTLYLRSVGQLYVFNGTAWTSLIWYQEGTFTPVLYGVTTAGSGTYTTQSGRYTRIGNRVDFSLALVWTAHTGTGEGRISGLPYTNAGSTVPCEAVNMNYAVSTNAVLVPLIEGGTSYIRLGDVTTGSGAQSFPSLDAAASLYVRGTYFL